MKKIGQLILLFFLTLIFLSNKSWQKKMTNSNENIFVNDSGYVSRKNGEKFLLELNKNDSIDFGYKKLDVNDTIGKYYKKENSKNYYLFLNDIINTAGPSQFILEVDAEGNIIRSERFTNGFYLCCWNNKFEGFGKLKDYYFIKNCGTGSGFCSSNIYLFKEISPQEELNTITQKVFSSICDGDIKHQLLSCSVTSKIEIKPKSVVFHYKYDKGIITKSNKFKIKKTENFDIEYFLKDKLWIALDSTKLKKIPNREITSKIKRDYN